MSRREAGVARVLNELESFNLGAASTVSSWTDVIATYFLDDDDFVPSSSDSESDSDDPIEVKDLVVDPASKEIKIHYSFDYAQQVHFPSDPWQPGPMYFLTPRKCGLFGVCCEGIPSR
ncbi:hypothetical protein SNE40_006022 [Patella caerulea]|uniref:Uncharacterized protein n=1 Tax=Patella caerulea TaxID=87958 RepID=A0AAN8K1K2_PATCE